MNVQRTVILNPITNRLHTIVLCYRLVLTKIKRVWHCHFNFPRKTLQLQFDKNKIKPFAQFHDCRRLCFNYSLEFVSLINRMTCFLNSSNPFLTYNSPSLQQVGLIKDILRIYVYSGRTHKRTHMHTHSHGRSRTHAHAHDIKPLQCMVNFENVKGVPFFCLMAFNYCTRWVSPRHTCPVLHNYCFMCYTIIIIITIQTRL